MGSTEKKTLKGVRLSCRYSNGMVVNFAGRVLSHEEETLRVVTSAQFDVGIPLTATCDVLPGPTVCRVAKVTRWEDQAGFFLLELNHSAPTKRAPPKAPSATTAGPNAAKAAAPGPGKIEVPEAFRAAAGVLAMKEPAMEGDGRR